MRIATSERNAMSAEHGGQYDGGFVRIYSGAYPGSPNDPLSGNTLLCEVELPSPALSATGDGELTFQGAPSGTIVAAGTATFARVYLSDGVTPISDLSLGTAVAEDVDLVLPTLVFAIGASVTIGGTVTVPESLNGAP